MPAVGVPRIGQAGLCDFPHWEHFKVSLVLLNGTGIPKKRNDFDLVHRSRSVVCEQ